MRDDSNPMRWMEKECNVQWPGDMGLCRRWNCISDLCHPCSYKTVQIHEHCSRGVVFELVLLCSPVFQVFYCTFPAINQRLHNLWLPIKCLTKVELNLFYCWFYQLLCIILISQRSFTSGSWVSCTSDILTSSHILIFSWTLHRFTVFFFMHSFQLSSSKQGNIQNHEF